MKSYCPHMNLPEPVVPAVQTIRLLKGQTALVTGANSGIGRAIAISLGKAAANVVVNYVTKPEDAEAVAEEIRSFGQRAMTALADVGDEAQVQAMFAAAVREFGTIDILVSNAGMERNASFHEMTTAQWDAVMNVNLRGAFLCSREAVREFMRRGVRPEVSVAAGKIIFISSVHDVIPWAGHVNYAASKGGLMLLMKSLAQEVAEKRIRVNAIAPGAIRTPINTAAWATPVGAFAGAVASTAIVFVLARGSGAWSPVRLLLTGVIIASGWGAMVALILSLAPETQLRGMLFWLMGDLSTPRHRNRSRRCLCYRNQRGAYRLFGSRSTDCPVRRRLIAVVYRQLTTQSRLSLARLLSKARLRRLSAQGRRPSRHCNTTSRTDRRSPCLICVR